MQFSLHPSQSGPVGPQTYPMVIFPSLEFIVGRDILSYLENRHTGSLTHGERTVMVGKLAWKPLAWSLPPHIANKKLHCYSWMDYRDLCHDQVFEGCRGGESYLLLVPLTWRAFAEDGWILDLREWQWDFCKLNQGMSQIPTAVPDMIPSTEKINTSSTWCVTWIDCGPSLSTEH